MTGNFGDGTEVLLHEILADIQHLAALLASQQHDRYTLVDTADTAPCIFGDGIDLGGCIQPEYEYLLFVYLFPVIRH